MKQIHGPEELDAVLASSPSDSVVVLMAKSAGCRPCKAFARKYARIAGLYGGVDGSDGGDGGDVSGKKNGATFLVVTGDESKETRAMMMAMKVRRTWRRFRCFRVRERERKRKAERKSPPTMMKKHTY